ncbi:hypothetical protein BH23ACT10_BH23ACT10_39330 [soil metagenome]
MATLSTALPRTLTRPRPGTDHRSKSRHRTLGLALGIVGVGLATITLIANFTAAGATGAADTATLAWAFGLTTTAFAIAKLGIAVILVGILVRLWIRVDSVKAALPALKADIRPAVANSALAKGDAVTKYGRATVTVDEPRPLLIHRMAQALWAPMLAMGAMAVIAGLVTSFVWSSAAASGSPTTAAAWTQGLQFLGEGMLLGGISFLLGSILAGLRAGGGQVQAELGVPVMTLRMPRTAKIFVGLMMAGMVVSVAQFVVYLSVASQTDPATVAANFAWLGPFRELGLGLLLAGIVLALATIAKVLGFQFWRIGQIIETGS